MRVYISGKIGEEVISDATRQKFAEAEEMLNKKGHNPVNVTSDSFQLAMKTSFDWRGIKQGYDEILLYCLQWLHSCTAIYMLPDWEYSPGANVELDFARATGKKVFWAKKEDAQVFRDDNETAESVWLPME